MDGCTISTWICSDWNTTRRHCFLSAIVRWWCETIASFYIHPKPQIIIPITQYNLKKKNIYKQWRRVWWSKIGNFTRRYIHRRMCDRQFYVHQFSAKWSACDWIMIVHALQCNKRRRKIKWIFIKLFIWKCIYNII